MSHIHSAFPITSIVATMKNFNKTFQTNGEQYSRATHKPQNKYKGDSINLNNENRK